MRFACRFARLPPEHPLADAQGAWPGMVDPRWITSGGAAGSPGPA
nr:hypothetical protein [Streptomyces sp. McG3]